MWEKIIAYFSRRHLMTNFLFLGVFIGGVFFWFHTSKEEMPDVTFDTVVISVAYPGASPAEVEHFVTKPIEDKLRGLDGLYSVTSNSNMGSCSVRIELEPDYPDKQEAVTEIRDAVQEVALPGEIPDEPTVRQFKTSRKDILDVALIDPRRHLLDYASRRELQAYALALENQLLNLPEVSSIRRTGYLQEEIQIKARPEKLIEFNVPLNAVITAIQNSHVRQPAGSLENKQESKVTLLAELDTPEKLRDLMIQGGFGGQGVRLGEVAEVGPGYEKNTSIQKINGHETIVLRVVKSSSFGILQAMKSVRQTIRKFKHNSLKNSPVQVVLLDDESRDVRNRLSLIGSNGALGFVLVLIMLLIFLDLQSSLWVALGIPFTFCFTMIFLSLTGYTINNITLAAIIIVMGMVVDDAIVVAENVARLRGEGTPFAEAAVKGTAAVFLPVVASILTTCVAFIPLFFFSGHFGKMVKFIPPVIFLMLGGSLFESIFILPSHLNLRFPRWLRVAFSLGTWPLLERHFARRRQALKTPAEGRHWFHAVEDGYGRLIERVLKRKGLVFLAFALLLGIAGWVFTQHMKFVMFPNEETTDVHLEAKAPADATKYETAELSRQIDDVFRPYLGREVVGFRSAIAQSHRGGAVEENKMSMRIELVPKEQRRKSVNQLIAEWEKRLRDVSGLEVLPFRKQRFGQASGSPIEVIVQENNDARRKTITDQVAAAMQKYPALTGVEIDRPLQYPEYKISLRRDKLKRLGINPVSIKSTLRALLEGTVLYELTEGDEEIDVRITAEESAKDNIRRLLNVPVENQANYLVPLLDIVDIQQLVSPNAINRLDGKRTTRIYADLAEGATQTPLEVAEYFESEVFPELMSRYPSSILSFGGEVKDTRESRGDFQVAVILVIFFIYIILALLFNSVYKPLLIMLAIPFGAVGIILAFWAHGMFLYGFFAAVGALGLAGVVVNDSIVMLAKLDREFDRMRRRELSNHQIAQIVKTRLRAVLLTTLTTVAAIFPTAYGVFGYDAMLAEMMLALAWGLLFGTTITLVLVPSLYSLMQDVRHLLLARLPAKAHPAGEE